MDKILVVPGYQGSDEQHWQTWLQQQYPQAERLADIDYQRPILRHWRKHIQQYLKAQSQPVFIVAHSFGCLAVAAAIADFADKVSAVLLVAPAAPQHFVSRGLAREFPCLPSISAEVPTKPLNTSGILIGSRDDPWMSFTEATTLATHWQLYFYDAGFAGHINAHSGYGAWPECKYLLDTLRSGCCNV